MECCKSAGALVNQVVGLRRSGSTAGRQGRPSVYGLILSQRAGQANCLPLSLFPSLLGPSGTRWSCRMASMRQILGSWHAPSKPVCRCAGDQPSCGQAQPPCLVQPPTGGKSRNRYELRRGNNKQLQKSKREDNLRPRGMDE